MTSVLSGKRGCGGGMTQMLSGQRGGGGTTSCSLSFPLSLTELTGALLVLLKRSSISFQINKIICFHGDAVHVHFPSSCPLTFPLLLTSLILSYSCGTVETLDSTQHRYAFFCLLSIALKPLPQVKTHPPRASRLNNHACSPLH